MICKENIVISLLAFFLSLFPFSTCLGAPTNIVSDVISTMADLELDCQSCSLSTGGVVTGHIVSLGMLGNSLPQLEAFFSKLSQKYQVEFVDFEVRPNPGVQGNSNEMSFSGKIQLSPGQSAFKLAPYLDPFAQLPFMTFQDQPLHTPKLMGFKLSRTNLDSSFQIVTPNLGEIENVLGGNQDKDWYILSASQNIVGGQAALTMEITRKKTPLNWKTGTSLFKTESNSETRVISISMNENVLKPSSRLVMEVSPNSLEKALSNSVLGGKFLSSAEISPKDNGSLQLKLQLETFSTNKAPDTKAIQAILAAPWPEEIGKTLSIRWKMGGIQVNIPVAEEAVAMTLHPIAQQVNLSFNGFDRKTKNGRTRLAAVFITHGTAVTKSSKKSGSSFDDLLSFATITESTPIPTGTRYTLEFPWSACGDLRTALSSLANQRIVLFQLEPLTDEKALCKIVLASGKIGANYAAPAQALLTAFFPPRITPTAAYVDGLEMNLSGEIYVCGTTPKSSLIFSRIFPRLKQIPGVFAPFFREGKYRGPSNDRKMRFRVTVEYRNKD